MQLIKVLPTSLPSRRCVGQGLAEIRMLSQTDLLIEAVMVGTLSWFCPPTLPDGYADGQEPCWRCKQTVCGWASLRTHSRAERTVAYVTPPALDLASCAAYITLKSCQTERLLSGSSSTSVTGILGPSENISTVAVLIGLVS